MVEHDLTRRELEVLILVDRGHRNRQIATALFITEQTVKFHLGKVYRKLDVATRTAAVHVARQRGWLPANVDEPPPPRAPRPSRTPTVPREDVPLDDVAGDIEPALTETLAGKIHRARLTLRDLDRELAVAHVALRS